MTKAPQFPGALRLPVWFTGLLIGGWQLSQTSAGDSVKFIKVYSRRIPLRFVRRKCACNHPDY